MERMQAIVGGNIEGRKRKETKRGAENASTSRTVYEQYDEAEVYDLLFSTASVAGESGHC